MPVRVLSLSNLPKVSLRAEPPARCTLRRFIYAKFGRLLEAKHGPEGGFSQPGVQTIAGKLNLEPRTVFLAFEILSLVTIVYRLLRCLAGLSRYHPWWQGSSLALRKQPRFSSLPVRSGFRLCMNKLAAIYGEHQALRTCRNHRPHRRPSFLLSACLAAVLQSPAAYNQRYRWILLGFPSFKLLIGGLIMAFGARIAGGCTSGHGLSGLSSLSFSSLVTVVAMFGAGVATQMLRT